MGKFDGYKHVASGEEGEGRDSGGQFAHGFPKTVETKTVNVPEVGEFVMYERPEFIEELDPVFKEMFRQLHYTPAGNEADLLKVYAVAIDPNGFIGFRNLV